MKMVNMAMGAIGRIASAESVSIELQSKLYALGIFPGVEIKVLRQCGIFRTRPPALHLPSMRAFSACAAARSSISAACMIP